MEIQAFTPEMLLAILPEISLVVLGALVLLLDLIWRGTGRRNLGWVTAAGLVVIIGLSVAFSRPAADPQLIFGGMLRFDGTAFVFRLIFMVGAAVTALLMVDQQPEGRQGEFYALMLIATLGMNLMASAANLIMLYLAIETTSLPLYILAGFLTKDPRSTEAGIKYFLFGAMTSAVMLYGFSLLYGFSGTTNLYEMAAQLGQIPTVILVLALMLVLVGFGFKVSAVPFHFWAPDVYEGAPTPVAGFLSTASKAAGFAVLMRMLVAVFPAETFAQMHINWTLLVSILAAASMIFGNVLALVQKNIKRLLAYSSIGQAGYVLIGVAAGSALGYAGATFYLISYLVTNLAAFGIVALVGRIVCSDEISAYAGLQRRNPALALALLVALLSLGGIPPFSGFVGKLLIFNAAVQSNLLWLAVVGIATSVIGLYYYLYVLKMVYAYPAQLPEADRPLPLSAPWKVAMAVCLIGILFIGTVFGPWYTLSSMGVTGLF
ncbi:MAG: NADH-quinone oxidoreductase subunit N [Chloroflexi bacterium]|nr:NADH-quinone oxidoreductase subunit N [Chloroflexota bacterium]